MTMATNFERRLAGHGRRSRTYNSEINGSARVLLLRAYCKTIAAQLVNEGGRYVGSYR